jgi:ferritin-like metal-binding protein YciE
MAELDSKRELDGAWEVERVSGLLPPLVGVRKEIDGSRGGTTVAGLWASFDVVGRELRYGRVLDGLVDLLEPNAEGGWDGRAMFRGREYARFRLRRVAASVAASLQDQLVRQIDDAIAMEEDVKRALDGMIETMDDPQVLAVLEQHAAETEEHGRRLRQRLDARGASPSLVREAGGIIGALARLPLDLVKGEDAGREAREAYATEHLEIAAYQLLERVATRAGDHETAQVARENRAEEEAMVRRLDELWDRFAERSLRREGVTV